MLRISCWICYWLGDGASRVLALNDNSELWCNIWYPIYNELMSWSCNIQDYAGFDPTKVEDTEGWPWCKATEEE